MRNEALKKFANNHILARAYRDLVYCNEFQRHFVNKQPKILTRKSTSYGGRGRIV